MQVAFELGLSEVLNPQTMRGISVPPNEDWGFNVPELQSLFPAGTMDHSVKPVYNVVISHTAHSLNFTC